METSWMIGDVLELQRLESIGLTFRVNGERIMVKPQNLLGIREAAWVAERKPALLELIAARCEWKNIGPVLGKDGQ